MAQRRQNRAQPVDDFVNKEESEVEENDIDEEDGPPVIDPYEVLGLDTEATTDEVKKAYRKLALKCHPDKAALDDKDAANKAFQEIAFAYAVLSDDRRRKRYDLTGSTAETMEDDDNFDWLKFYREQFEHVVNEQAINNVANEYKGSAEERRDLIKAYNKFSGNLQRIYAVIMLSDILVDDDRFRQIFDEEIRKGTIEAFPAYEEETDETRQRAKEAEKKRRDEYDQRQAAKEEASTAKTNGKAKSKSKKSGADDMAGLAALIQQRQKSRAGNFFDSLEAKYAPKPRGSKRSTPMGEPPEDMFQANRKKQKPNERSKKKAKDESEDDDMGLDEEDIGDSEEEVPVPRKIKARPKARGRGKASTRASAF
ncbi:DnaJ-domain-containing protein [Clathrospora elynae]|uniref:DnaJ-domain-containing protein n=1 Tax=Clathrospora elynae TaxID=706981 RepID=A0A6A5SAK8_9PLEO|nr:DnaJ-domain-containing protein [Clathrospora elynae]